LQTESRRIGDQSYALKIDVQVQAREEQFLRGEVEQLEQRRTYYEQTIGTLTGNLTADERLLLQMRDEVEQYKAKCQEIRIDIEEVGINAGS
jgi:predicted  nucleic acid-binding Zn-ribbon protein